MECRSFRLFGVAIMLAIALASLPGTILAQELAIGETVEVVTEGAALNMRAAPDTSAPIVARLPAGMHLLLVSGPRVADGHQWWEAEGSAGRGWVAANWLRPSTTPADTPVGGGLSCTAATADEAIRLCALAASTAHILLIDLGNPHVRLETILAGDVSTTAVRPFPREWVRQMVARYPGVVAAINADYFGGNRGPEGLAIKNGLRLDDPRPADLEDNHLNRSSLRLGKSPLDEPGMTLQAGIFRLESDGQLLEADSFYNAVGGGPQVVFDGQWAWERKLPNSRHNGCVVFPTSDIINGECFHNTDTWDRADTMWTVVALTEDGQMAWVLAPFGEMARTLERLQVRQAIKLDGGGSSQLWYLGEDIVAGSRPVVNALAVFYLQAFSIVEQPRWPVVLENETATIRLVLRNEGAEVWPAGTCGLENRENPWGSEESRPLADSVAPGETATWEWTTEAFASWGVQRSVWQMACAGRAFPEEAVTLRVIVLPGELAERRAELERQIRAWIEEGRENMEQAIMTWLEELLCETARSICPDAFLPLLLALAAGLWPGRGSARRSQNERSGSARTPPIT